MKENERLFGDGALGMVRALVTPAVPRVPPPRRRPEPGAFPPAGRADAQGGVQVLPGPAGEADR